MIKILIFCLSFNFGVRPGINDSTLVEEIYSVIEFFITYDNIINDNEYIRNKPISFYLFERRTKSDKISSLKKYFKNLNETLIDTIFTEADLDYMLEQYEQKNKIRWSYILKTKMSYAIVKEKRTEYLSLTNEKPKRKIIYGFSIPLFNKERDKVLIYTLYYNIDYAGFMYLLYKNNDKWEIKIEYLDYIT